ncbi:putative 1-aminocyclopropane-1-carboxylate oxidase [Hypoxylon sp. FL1150]|nr:putative 1-aminocyclopropane-1-carboxylate oxidase [Hypoxylon sp. FL1150]
MFSQIAENTIPTVDISAILSPTASKAERVQVIEDVRHASTTYGFFNLVGHGIPHAQLQQAFESSKRFFALPEEKRMDVHVGKAMGRSFRGWEPPLIQQHQENLLPDTKETFIVGREVPADDPEAGSFLTGPNLWPDLPKKEFQDVVLAYQARMVALAQTIINILVQGLPEKWGCPPDALDGLTVDPAIPMRFLHYGPVKEKDPRQFGVAAHTDFSAITILLQQPGTEGLQVWYPPTEDWIPVPVVEDGFVINIGDLMQKYTGGYYRSARHRVITFSEEDKHRYSIAFFLDGNLQFKTKGLDGSDTETVVGDYVRACLMRTLGTKGPLL